MEIEMNIALWALLTAVGGGGIAWGGVKVGLNGTKARVQRIEEKLDGHAAQDSEVQVAAAIQMTRIETKLDDLIKALGQ